MAAFVNGVALASRARARSRPRCCAAPHRAVASGRSSIGLLDAADAPAVEGVVSEAASQAIEAFVEREIVVPDPRKKPAGAISTRTGALCPGRACAPAPYPVCRDAGHRRRRLRQRAEACLLDAAATTAGCRDGFADAARTLSNRLSSAGGGDGLARGRRLRPSSRGSSAASCADRRAAAPRAQPLSACTSSRCWRAGRRWRFEAVRGAVATTLRQQTWVTALRQLLQLLADRRRSRGVDRDAAARPLVQ